MQRGAELESVERPKSMQAQQAGGERLHRLDVDDHVTGPHEVLAPILRAPNCFFFDRSLTQEASERGDNLRGARQAEQLSASAGSLAGSAAELRD